MPKHDPASSAPPGGSPPDAPKQAEAKPAAAKLPEQQTREEWLADVRKRAAAKDAKLLPEEWLEVAFPGTLLPNGRVKREGGHAAAKHGAAKNLHGWDVDAYHAPPQGRLRLSREDYEAALKATRGKATVVEKQRTEPGRAPSHPGKRKAAGPPAPHGPALSPWPAKLRELAGVKE